MADTKETIYVDVDDEITVIIDKVKAANAKVLALVLPKRASVLQSIVNMKLLKRSADSEKKNLVLITSEAGLLPLAGAVGLHVAKTLTSAPEIPPSPAIGSDSETVDEDMSIIPLEPEADEETPDLTKEASLGASVGALDDAAKHASKTDKTLETLKLDDEEEPKPESGKQAKVPKDKHLKVPNFDRFRLFLVLGIIVIIGLIVLAVFALSVWPHAGIFIKTNATSVNTSESITLDPQATSANLASGDIPATQVSEQKTFTQTVNTTGQQNTGNSASGTINMVAVECNGNLPSDVPQGMGVSYNNLTYITEADTSFTLAGAHNKGGGCDSYPASASTPISAQSPGTAYNTNGNVNFSVAGRNDVSGTGSASGGTDNFVQIVSQADITSATAKINASNNSTVEADLASQLRGQNLYPINVTFAAGTPQITSSPSVGAQGSTVAVTEIITFTMFGAKQSDINAIVDANIQSQTTKNQNIISNGVNEAAFKQTGTSGTTDEVTLATTAVVGPNISPGQIRQEVKGKSANAAIAAIKQNPDITSVTIKLSPFWVTSVPGNPSKITVNIAKPSTN